jgi:hypothetical protein
MLSFNKIEVKLLLLMLSQQQQKRADFNVEKWILLSFRVPAIFRICAIRMDLKKMKEAVTGWLASVFSPITGNKSIRGYKFMREYEWLEGINWSLDTNQTPGNSLGDPNKFSPDRIKLFKILFRDTSLIFF